MRRRRIIRAGGTQRRAAPTGPEKHRRNDGGAARRVLGMGVEADNVHDGYGDVSLHERSPPAAVGVPLRRRGRRLGVGLKNLRGGRASEGVGEVPNDASSPAADEGSLPLKRLRSEDGVRRRRVCHHPVADCTAAVATAIGCVAATDGMAMTPLPMVLLGLLLS